MESAITLFLFFILFGLGPGLWLEYNKRKRSNNRTPLKEISWVRAAIEDAASIVRNINNDKQTIIIMKCLGRNIMKSLNEPTPKSHENGDDLILTREETNLRSTIQFYWLLFSESKTRLSGTNDELKTLFQISTEKRRKFGMIPSNVNQIMMLTSCIMCGFGMCAKYRNCVDENERKTLYESIQGLFMTWGDSFENID